MTFLAILFWLLVIFSFLGVFIPVIERPSRIVLLVCIAILGLRVFGNPFAA